MAKISEMRLEKYRRLAAKGLWDLDHDGFNRFFARARAENVELISNSFSTQGMFRAPHRKDLDGVDLAIVGVPLDLGVPNPRPGTRLGPEAVRYWSKDRNMVNYHTEVVPFDLCSIIDWGDVDFDRDAFNLNACIDELTKIYSAFKEKNINTLTIGGEHTITYAILAAFGKDEPLSVIHLDAHGDTAVMFGGASVSDASIFQLATVEGVIDPERTIQIGMRGRGIIRCEFSQASGMRMIKVEEFQALGVDAVVEEARNIVGEGPVYLTIDTDVFDCSVMPGTTLPEPFGLSGTQVRDVIRGLRGLNIVGADLMELSPPYDPTGMSACLASGIAFELLCLLAESRCVYSGTQRKTHWEK
jgi:agmatinase